MKTRTSKFTDELVSDAQALVDIVLERMFAKRGLKLTKKYWQREECLRDYKLQLIYASSLLKLYSFQAIINALRSKQGLNIWSLNAKWLDPIIKIEQAKIDKKEKEITESIKNSPVKITEPTVQGNSIRPTFKTKQSILDKLE